MRAVHEGIKRIQVDIPFVGGSSLLRLRCNVYAIQTESEVVLFDCGSKETAAALHPAVQAERNVAVYLTHGHADHAGGGMYWLRRGAKVFAHEKEHAMLRSGGPEGVPGAFRYPPFEPTGTVSRGESITAGKQFDFVVLATPGHTPGSVCYYDERNDILVCGDLLFGPIWGHMLTFLLEFATAIRQPNIDIRRQIGSLEQLVNARVIKESTLILPGHGPRYCIQEKPDAVRRTSRLLRLRWPSKSRSKASLGRG